MNSLKRYLIKKAIPAITNWLNKIAVEKKLIRYKPINLESLTPTCESDEDDVYKSAIINALENPNNQNIGITGSYGSGKSSVLESFIKNHNSEYRFIKISLASFNENNLVEIDNQKTSNKSNIAAKPETDGKRTKTNIDETILPDDEELHKVNQLIELSILQQLLYHVNSEELPSSRFTRINRGKCYTNLGIAVLFFLWLVSFLIIAELGFITDTTIWAKLNWKENSEIIVILAFTYFSIGSICILYQITRFITNSKLNKLNLKDGEIEVNRTDERSILNRYLDEVFYFFETTKYNVVIIEDLDRLKNSMIFTKLRELNNLLNNSDQIKNKVGRIAFIYALRDDLFKDKSRTKFFDIIIPIIPIINTTNSGDKFLQLLKKAQLDKSISHDFLNDISLFIDDMRLLKNIYNEYQIYKEKLKKVPDQSKLLAMVIFKNIYPDEFIKLHDCSSIVYMVLKSEKSTIVKSTIDVIDQKIKKLNEQLEPLENIMLRNEDELKAVYINSFWKELDKPSYISDKNGLEVLFSELSDAKNFNRLRNNEFNKYYSHESGNTSIPVNFRDIEKKVNSERDYSKRLFEIQNKTNKLIEKLTLEIEALNKEKREITSFSLKELSKRESITTAFPGLDNQRHRLTLYLLRNGYIDEDYDLYISYFHEASLTPDDRKFLLAVKSFEPQEFSFKLTNIKEIISKLRIPEFAQKEILNKNLLDFLINKKDEYQHQLNVFFEQLINESEASMEFIDMYIDEDTDKEYFINQLCRRWPNIWNYIDLYSKYSNERKDKYLALIIKGANPSDIVNLDGEKRLSTYILNQPHFLLLVPDEDLEKAKSLILNLNIQFTQLVYQNSDSQLLKYIYENERYEINQNMIEFMIRSQGNRDEQLTDLLKMKNYSTIKVSNCMNLLSYIHKNINHYVENVYLRFENNEEDTEESILELLNTEDLYSDLKEKMLLKNRKKISFLSKVRDKELYDFIAKNFKMLPRWDNIYTYLEKENKGQPISLKDIDSALASFLNQKTNYEELSKKKITEVTGIDEVLSKLLCDKIVFCQSLTINTFKSLRKSIPYYYPSFSRRDISSEKIDYMISSGFLAASPNNFDFLRNYYSPKHIKLVELKRADFISSIDKFKLRGDDVLQIFKSKIFSETQKNAILKSLSPNILYGEKYVCDFIFEFLEGKKEIDLPLKLIESLFRNGTNDTDKIKLFNLILTSSRLDFKTITLLLEAIGYPYSRLTKKGVTQKFVNREGNKSLLSLLAKRGCSFVYLPNIKGYIRVKTAKE